VELPVAPGAAFGAPGVAGVPAPTAPVVPTPEAPGARLPVVPVAPVAAGGTPATDGGAAAPTGMTVGFASMKPACAPAIGPIQPLTVIDCAALDELDGVGDCVGDVAGVCAEAIDAHINVIPLRTVSFIEMFSSCAPLRLPWSLGALQSGRHKRGEIELIACGGCSEHRSHYVSPHTRIA